MKMKHEIQRIQAQTEAIKKAREEIEEVCGDDNSSNNHAAIVQALNRVKRRIRESDGQVSEGKADE